MIILGPTASGKSELAVGLAKKFNGEVISADSRQIYRGLDIGTGKIPRDRPNAIRMKSNRKRMFDKNSRSFASNSGEYLHRGIRHHLLDVASPKRIFTVAQYQKLAGRALQQILRRGKLPIICGGTGLYIDALLYNTSFPAVPPNPKLRRELEKEPAEKLFARLQKLDPRRAANIDRHNKRRLVRALEIVLSTGKPIPSLITARGGQARLSASGGNRRISNFDILKIGVRLPDKKLKQRIHTRLIKRIRQGMIGEAEKLHRGGLGWRRMEELGLEYRYLARYLQGKISKEEMVRQLGKEIRRYAKRQMTWFSARGGSAMGGKRDKKIHWIQKPQEAIGLTLQFLLK